MPHVVEHDIDTKQCLDLTVHLRNYKCHWHEYELQL